MWLDLALFVVSVVLTLALQPGPPKPPNAATMSDVNVPTVKAGTPVPVVFGDVWIENWMVLWYGDLSNQPIYSSGGKGK
jgi:hypothetical protein